MRRHLPRSAHFTALVLILALTLSFIYVTIATSQDSAEIISKLRELQGDVSALSLEKDFENTHAAKGQRKALMNKIDATIHQIKAGAYKGAIKKLENDMKHTIEAWITETCAASLIEKVNDIIKLIKGELPPSPDFSIEASPTSLSIVQGDSDTVTITITSLGGFDQPVQLSISGTPSGVTNSFNPEQVSPPADGTETSTLTISVDISAIPGIYILTVTGTSGSIQDSKDVTLEVTKLPPIPDFSIEANPAFMTISQGGSDTSIIAVTSINGFEDLVNLTVSPAIDDVTYSLDPPTVIPPADDTTTSTLTIAVAETAIPNTYVLVLTGTSGDLQNSASLSLEITAAPPPPDLEPPTVRIEEPANGSHVTGLVNIVVFIYDKNFKRAELTINNTLIASWTPGNVSLQGAEHPISWDTTLPEYPDDIYNITLSAEDEAGNSDESCVTGIVDNTLPTVRIDEPIEGSYLAGIVGIKVFIQEDNFDKAELTINDTEVVSWTLSGEHIVNWNTTTYGEGICLIKLNALDKAGNVGEKTVKVTVDNTSPIIEATAWTPNEPSTDEQINVTVKVVDPQPGSGVQNVTLWHRNTTRDDWQSIPMSLNVTSGNWTATIPAQYAETTVEFYIEAFDNAGNKAVTDNYEYNVIAPAGIPLAWIVAVISLILAATAAAIYFWRKRRIRKQGISSRA